MLHRSNQPTALLCSAGLGTDFGGVGVVAEALYAVLAERFAVEHLCYQADQSWRSRAKFAARLTGALWRNHRLRVFSHVDLTRSLPYTPAPIAAAPNIVFVHGIEVWKPLDQARTKALQRAKLLCNSHFTDARMRQFHPAAVKAEIVHLGVEFSAQPSEAQILQGKSAFPTVVIVGRMSQSERYKGHDQLLEAWPTLTQQIPDAQLICVGSGDDLPRLRDKAERLGVNAQFLTGLDDASRARVVQSAHVFAFPSSAEGFGLAAIEAAAMGVPVLGLAGMVIEEILPDALLIPAQSAEAISSALVAGLADRQALHQRGLRSMAWVRTHFTRAQFGARFWHALAQQGIVDA